eukprot:TRINITY_DN6219_c0_g2_i1.p1 TRINITY_DN6219_c0_g2~~TRINITY_DN6219_c0_g2_i1.p1  ORF type:complete len:305 (-),score=65.14 TRINITY_DN6219_c0_g2_i1:306-1220(-)
MGCHNSKAAAASVSVPSEHLERCASCEMRKVRAAGKPKRPQVIVEQEVAAAPASAQTMPDESVLDAPCAPELKAVPVDEQSVSTEDSSQETAEPHESAERLERDETEDSEFLETRQVPVQCEVEHATAREGIPCGPVPQAKTYTRPSPGDVEPVALEAEFAVPDADVKAAEQQRTTVVDVPEERPQAVAAAPAAWSTRNPLQALGHGLELIQSTISDSLLGESTASEENEQGAAAEDGDQAARKTMPRPEEVPLPTFDGKRSFGPSPSMPQKMSSRHEEMRSCSSGVDEVFKSCIGHRGKGLRF